MILYKTLPMSLHLKPFTTYIFFLQLLIHTYVLNTIEEKMLIIIKINLKHNYIKSGTQPQIFMLNVVAAIQVYNWRDITCSLK